MKIRNLAMIVAASGIAIAPVATASAQVRASAPLAAASALQDDMAEDDDGGGTPVWLGLILIIVLGIIVTASGGKDPGPVSP